MAFKIYNLSWNDYQNNHLSDKSKKWANDFACLPFYFFPYLIHLLNPIPLPIMRQYCSSELLIRLITKFQIKFNKQILFIEDMFLNTFDYYKDIDQHENHRNFFIRQLLGTIHANFKDTFTIRYPHFSNNVYFIQMTSNYKQVFTIHVKIRVTFEFYHVGLIPNIDIQFTIDYPYLKDVRNTHQLEGKIQQLNLKSAQSLFLVFDNLRSTQVHLFSKIHFKKVTNTDFYPQQIQKQIHYVFAVCNEITQISKNLFSSNQVDLTQDKVHFPSSQRRSSYTQISYPPRQMPFLSYEKPSNSQALLMKKFYDKKLDTQQNSGQNSASVKGSTRQIMKCLNGMMLVEKEPNNYREFFSEEERRHGFLKNPDVVRNTNQVTRSVAFNYSQDRKETKLSGTGTGDFQGSFSKIFIIEDTGEKKNTLMHNRRGGENVEYNPDPSQDQVKIEMIYKTVGGNNIENAQESFENQLKYLTDYGGLKCPFINNYYLEYKKSGKGYKAGPKNKIYSDFHRMNAWNKFSDSKTRNYTMSDMINFAEQVLIALKDFYLSVGFLHRDLKDLNILISDDGVIKIIDNGSVFPYFDMQEVWNPSRKKEMDKIRQQYHSELRSSIYVKNKTYIQHEYDQLKDYDSFLDYKKEADTHRTFDVYSLGIMLSEMLQDYNYDKAKWMEATQLWNGLISKMRHLDPRYRIQVEEAIEYVKYIRRRLLKDL